MQHVKLSKQELKNIIDKGWAARRAAALEKKERNSGRAKEWKARELQAHVLELSGEQTAREFVDNLRKKRRKYYRPPQV